MKRPKRVWLVAYINQDYMDTVKKDLKKHESLSEIRIFIPTVKVLKKQFKNKLEYETVPFLFNYGFVRVPFEKCNDDFLKTLQDKIPSIFGFLKDPMKLGFCKPQVDEENKRIKFDKHIAYATVPKKYIVELKERADSLSIYNKKDIRRLKPDMVISLMGYPWEGLLAKILSIDTKRKKLQVEVFSELFNRKVEIDFDNAIYSIYQNHYMADAAGKEKSSDELSQRSKNVMDKIMFKNGSY